MDLIQVKEQNEDFYFNNLLKIIDNNKEIKKSLIQCDLYSKEIKHFKIGNNIILVNELLDSINYLNEFLIKNNIRHNINFDFLKLNNQLFFNVNMIFFKKNYNNNYYFNVLMFSNKEVNLNEKKYYPLWLLKGIDKFNTSQFLLNKKNNQEQKTYLMVDTINNVYKIGKSLNPNFRERTLLSQKPFIKTLFICNKNIESKLHKKYSNKRIRGEWFKLSESDIKEIENIFNNHNQQS